MLEEQLTYKLIYFLAPLSLVVLIVVVTVARRGSLVFKEAAHVTPWILLAINALAWLTNWGFQSEVPYMFFLTLKMVFVPLFCLVIACLYVIAWRPQDDRDRRLDGRR
jgi:hypothetical protein